MAKPTAQPPAAVVVIPPAAATTKPKGIDGRTSLKLVGGGSVTLTALRNKPEERAKANRKPTGEANSVSASLFRALEGAYAWFNERLFQGQLLPVVLNFSRHANCYGFFAPNRWFDAADGELATHEISLNPSHLRHRDLRATYSTLVHEMVHCWQEEKGKKKSKRGYHNNEWAEMMKRVGLQPTTTGLPGGSETGYKVTHMVMDGGAYDQAFQDMPDELKLPWLCEEPEKPEKEKRAKSKLKYTCAACDARAWAKPGAKLKCGDCDEVMTPEEDEEDTEAAAELAADRFVVADGVRW